jgi:cytochrome c peroxidase
MIVDCIKTAFYHPVLLVLFTATLAACQPREDKDFRAFTNAMGQAHDYGAETSNFQLLQEPLRPLPESLPIDEDKAALGKRLFHEVRLSADNSISCASCHDLAAGGDDGRKVSTGVGGATGVINAPTVLNSGLNFAQFWNGRARDLKEQAAGPVLNPVEMASSWPEVIGKLSTDPVYEKQFSALYRDGITADNITDALAEFERSLITPSPFDQFLRGNQGAISAQARSGYEKFKRYGCASCHQGVNVGGNMYQKFGALVAYYEDRSFNDADRGRAAVTSNRQDLHVFKVPSLRNVARTAPYFHDGSAENLEQAIHTMAALQLGRTLPDDDVADIKHFLTSLSGQLP